MSAKVPDPIDKHVGERAASAPADAAYDAKETRVQTRPNLPASS